jgi:hypothetical protein
LRVFRERDVDAGGSLDFADFAEEDVEHNPIDGVIGPVEKTGFDFGGFLAKAVDAAFALF